VPCLSGGFLLQPYASSAPELKQPQQPVERAREPVYGLEVAAALL